MCERVKWLRERAHRWGGQGRRGGRGPSAPAPASDKLNTTKRDRICLVGRSIKKNL